jgi:hypothetical protein
VRRKENEDKECMRSRNGIEIEIEIRIGKNKNEINGRGLR